MLTINDTFPDFKIKVVQNKQEKEVSSSDLKGSWSIIFFYPEAFSFICPTEVAGFEKHYEFLNSKDTNLIGISVDKIDTLKRWADKIDVSYMLGSDKEAKLVKKIGVLDKNDLRAHRATFILDPELTIQFAMVTARNVGRSVEETIRVYKAIQTGKKCPADYRGK